MTPAPSRKQQSDNVTRSLRMMILLCHRDMTQDEVKDIFHNVQYVIDTEFEKLPRKSDPNLRHLFRKRVGKTMYDLGRAALIDTQTRKPEILYDFCFDLTATLNQFSGQSNNEDWTDPPCEQNALLMSWIKNLQS